MRYQTKQSVIEKVKLKRKGNGRKYSKLAKSQQLWIVEFFSQLRKGALYDGRYVVPKHEKENIKRIQALFQETFWAPISRKEERLRNTYLYLTRVDPEQKLKLEEYLDQMYFEFMRAMQIIDYPAFSEARA